jgi:pimeloyl-ACP methyl ester carboxylesterase
MEPIMHFGYADTKLGQIHYREMGTGQPLLLFHESPVSGAIYNAALPLLAEQLRAIAPDTPGYGASTPPPHPLSIEEYTERLFLMLDCLGLDQVALFGNHTGAAIATQFAWAHPERVKALIIQGAALFTDADRKKFLVDLNWLEPFPLAQDGSHLKWLWARYKRIWGEDTPVQMLHEVTTEFLRVATRYDWAYKAAFMFDGEKLLPELKCPTLYLISEGDMLRYMNERAVALTPNSEGMVIDNPHGHLHRREPEIFAREICAFLKRAGYLAA